MRGGLAAGRFNVLEAGPAPTGAYPEVRQRLADAGISEAVREHALGILDLLAEAEASVHGVPLTQVHFHELADWDTQADIVAAASIIDLLGEVRWCCRPLPLGEGTVSTAHGLLPVPVPAVTQLLTGFAFRPHDGIPGERVTPTGAAILRYLRADCAPRAGVLIASGAGAGSRDLPGFPNVLRVFGFRAAEDNAHDDDVLVIEFDVDDESAEELATGLDHLRMASGIIDVTSFQGVGKKGRWVQAVRILADPKLRDSVARVIFDQTATLGLRFREERRVILARKTHIFTTEHGPVRVKVAHRPSGQTAKPEADDVAANASNAKDRAHLRRRAVEQTLQGTETHAEEGGGGATGPGPA